MFSTKLLSLQNIATSLAADIAPFAAEVDKEAAWPSHSMAALSKAGLMGLQVPEQFGGHGQGLLALAVLTETLGKACPSSAMCFGMHCVATAVIAAKATSYQSNNYLSKIARGEHITSLGLSESGTGAHFYLSETVVTLVGGHGSSGISTSLVLSTTPWSRVGAILPVLARRASSSSPAVGGVLV